MGDGKLGGPRRLFRIVFWIARTLGSLFALMIAIYLGAILDEHVEARRAMRVYNQILAVRLGDSVAEFDSKAPACKISTSDGEYQCVQLSITQRIEDRVDWYLMHAHPDVYLWQSIRRQKIGLRDWHFVLWVTVHEGSVSELNAHFIVVGRDMALGCSWGMLPELLPSPIDPDSTSQKNPSTALSGTQITGAWSGSGYRMEFTPSSSARDLSMREVNVRCMTSFRGCRDSRELLPNLPPPPHPRYW